MNRRVVFQWLSLLSIWLPSAVVSAIPADEPDPRGLSGGLTLGQAVGLGSLVENPSTGQMKMPYAALSLTLDGRWGFTDHLALKSRLLLEWELTSSYVTTTNERHQLSPSDLQVTLAHGALWTERWVTGLVFDGDLRVYLPTSRESRYATQLVGLSARIGISRSLGGFDLSIGSRYIHHLPRYTQPVVPAYPEQEEERPCVGHDVESGTSCGGTSNLRFQFVHDFSIGYDLTDRLSATATLLIRNQFGYAQPLDEYRAPRATAETQRDSTWGTLDLTYALNDHVSYALGVSSFQPARTEDGQHFRFPFWELEGRAENYVTFYLDVEGRF